MCGHVTRLIISMVLCAWTTTADSEILSRSRRDLAECETNWVREERDISIPRDYDGTTLYELNKDFCFDITAPDGQVVALTFLRFNVEESSLDPLVCEYDWVRIYDGEEAIETPKLENRLCGPNLPPEPYVSSTSRMYIRLHSDHVRARTGFVAQVRFITPIASVEDCTELRAGTGEISMPRDYDGENREYRNNEDVCWIIRGRSGESITLAIRPGMRLQSSDNDCEYDAITLYDGDTASVDNRIDRICGRSSEMLFWHTQSSAMLVHFTSDDSSTRTGFTAVYSNQLNPDEDSCERVSTSDDQGSFSFNPRTTDARCWTLRAGRGKRLSFGVTYDDEKYHRGCNTRALSFYNGLNTDPDRLIEHDCYQYIVPIESSGSDVVVMFINDEGVEDLSVINVQWGVIDDENPVDDCGRPEVNPVWQSRITGGHTVEPHSWPWMAFFYGPCSGTIVSEFYILTTARCVEMRDHLPYYIEVGTEIRERNIREAFKRRYIPSRAIIHPRYDDRRDGDPNYDIALIRVSERIEFNRHVNRICLPRVNSSPRDTRCAAVGWDNIREGTLGEEMQQIRLTYNDRCERDFFPNDPDFNPDTRICGVDTSNSGVDVCNGDSGGPLMCEDSSGVWTQYGIASSGLDCGADDSPSIFTKVAEFRDWIDEYIDRDL